MTTEVEDASWVDVQGLVASVVSTVTPQWPLVSTESASSGLRYVRWQANFTTAATDALWSRGTGRRFTQGRSGRGG
jgi:hypothetical protein